MKIGPYLIKNRVFLAPMAGVTDNPFRQLCRRLGAGLAYSEMVSANALLYASQKTRWRLNHEGEQSPRIVQIAGGDVADMVQAARYNAEHGAEIIDINMGCPAKKVCNKAAGSALMKDPGHVAAILTAVVGAVTIPVTLKIRTGWSQQAKNALLIAQIAEEAGISALSIHGRTREARFTGHAEYDTIAAVKAALNIPVIANGDIATPEQAAAVLAYTKADAVMIGRAAQGRPWLFGEINHYLNTNTLPPALSKQQIYQFMLEHLQALYDFYGDYMGVRIARKHVGWYCKQHAKAQAFRQQFNALASPDDQLAASAAFFLA